MTRLSRRFNYGSEIKNVNGMLYNQLNDSYFSIALSVNTKSTRVEATIDAPANDQVNSGLDVGDLWINTTLNRAWIMTSRVTSEIVTWTIIT